MKYAIITGAAGGLANQIINTIKNEYTIFALDKSSKLNGSSFLSPFPHISYA